MAQAIDPAGPARPGLKAVGVQQEAARAAAAADPLAKPGIKLEFRNVAKADITVYPVDLMQLYLTRRNLNAIAGIDLAGISPLVERSVVLGDGSDYDDRSKTIELPLTKEGAYLVMIRGDNLYTSGIVLVTPLELEVLEEPASGRVRISVRDARTRELLPKVGVKVIGTNNPQFFSGETDLRGVFVAEGVQGQVSAVVRKGAAEYAFYRGTTYVGQPPVPPAPTNGQQAGQQAPANSPPGMNQALDANLRMQNSTNYERQIRRLQERYQQVEPAKPPGAAAGGFK